MTVRELNRDELDELKQNYVAELMGETDYSYNVLLDALEDITDEFIFEHYAGIDFVKDDFWCNYKS